MRPAALLGVGILLAGAAWPQQTAHSFLEGHLRHARVKVAAREKDAEWRGLFQKRHLHFPPVTF